MNDQIKEAIAKAIEPVVYKVGMTHEEAAKAAAQAHHDAAHCANTGLADMIGGE